MTGQILYIDGGIEGERLARRASAGKRPIDYVGRSFSLV
jgi:hypothetical protein